MREVPAPLRLIASIASGLAGAGLVVIIGLTVADVVSRNLWNQSILGTVDFASLLLVAIAFLGLAAAEIDDRHVSVDLIEMHMKPVVRIIFAFIRIILVLGIGLLLMWGISEVVMSAWDRHEETNGVLRLPTWPAKVAMWISFAYFVLIATWNAINEYRDMKDGIFEESHTLAATQHHADDVNQHERDRKGARA